MRLEQLTHEQFVDLLDLVLEYHVTRTSTTLQMRGALHCLRTGERKELHSQKTVADYVAHVGDLFRDGFMAAIYVESMRRHNELMISWRDC